MRLVSQDYLSDDTIADECEDYRGGHKNFVHARFKGYQPAWTYEGTQFQLTLHIDATQGSPVVGFACGRIKSVFDIETAIVEMYALSPAARYQMLGLKMHEYIMKTTGLPLAAAHTQTPDGCRLLKRLLSNVKGVIMTAIDENKQRYKIADVAGFDALPFDLFDGRDATIITLKRGRDNSPSELTSRRVGRKRGVARPTFVGC